MKKILLIALLISLKASAQRIDTVTVTGLQLRADHLAVFIGATADFKRDSATTKALLNIRTAVQNTPNLTPTSVIAIPPIRGEIVLGWYSWMKQGGMTVAMYESFALANNNPLNPSTAIKAINNSALQYFIGIIDGAGSTRTQSLYQSGKSIVMD